ncbi:MAG: hypothetical protein JJE07_08725 [Flavobacteriaceae bacterium]|nr:hypothetical protein [Flavobacteriaceae bacterium]
MKIIKIYLVCLAVTGLLFTSCSKEDESSLSGLPGDEAPQTATLSFGAVLNDLVSNSVANEQHIPGDVPACSDAAPTKVRVALKDAQDTWVAGQNGDTGGFIEIPVIPNGEGGWMTKESDEVELPQGQYTLEYFAVLDAGNNVLWIAPRENDDYGYSNFAAFVSDPLPININLRDGVKKYVNVEVLCYDERFADEFGYLFFNFTGVRVIILGVYGNICDETGRHSPAHFRFDVWTYSGDPLNPKGTPLFNANNPLMNEHGVYEDTGDEYSMPLWVALPDNEDVNDLFYAEMWMIDEQGDPTASDPIRMGEFTQEGVESLFYSDNGVERAKYLHFRDGCGSDGMQDDSDPTFFFPPN